MKSISAYLDQHQYVCMAIVGVIVVTSGWIVNFIAEIL